MSAIVTETLDHLTNAAVHKRQKDGAPVVVGSVGRWHISPVTLSGGQTRHCDVSTIHVSRRLKNVPLANEVFFIDASSIQDVQKLRCEATPQ